LGDKKKNRKTRGGGLYRFVTWEREGNSGRQSEPYRKSRTTGGYIT